MAQSVEKQPTLDRIVQGQVEELRKAVEDVKKGLSELAERVARVEMNADVSQTGLNEIYRTLELHGLMKNGEPVKDSKPEPTAAVKEETFTCLTFEDQQGAKLGQFSVAFKQSNLVDKWASAFNVLRQSNATIQSRYHGPNYQFSYWLYGQDKIYRQLLRKQETKT